MIAEALFFMLAHREFSDKNWDKKAGAEATGGGADELADWMSGAERSAK
jgi:hypothetical protein